MSKPSSFLGLLWLIGWSAPAVASLPGELMPKTTTNECPVITELDSNVTFLLTDTVDLPDDCFANPGQLSRSGLHYYLSLARTGVDSLYVLSRTELKQPFGPPQLLAGKINTPSDTYPYALLPSLTADEKTMVYVRSDGTWEGNDLFLALRADTTEPFDSIRPLSEINTEQVADAYPCISPDGLRLYYTRNNMLMLSARPDPQSLFGEPTPVPILRSQDDFSCWLTDDEREIYYRGWNKRALACYARRESIAGEFSSPVEHPELEGFHFFAGFSTIQDELYMYMADGVRSWILVFESQGTAIGDKTPTRRTLPRSLPTRLVSTTISLSNADPSTEPMVLCDITGRSVVRLHTGDNDVYRLAPGVYFIRTGSRISARVIITN